MTASLTLRWFWQKRQKLGARYFSDIFGNNFRLCFFYASPSCGKKSEHYHARESIKKSKFWEITSKRGHLNPLTSIIVSKIIEERNCGKWAFPRGMKIFRFLLTHKESVVPDVGRKNIRPSILFSIFKMLQRN